MRLYITGATGFVGRHVVAEAVRRGHEVVAVVRPSSTGFADDESGLIQSRAVDLRSRAGLAESLADVDAVIHLAAAKAGDFYTQFAGTVVATENLLAAMAEAEVDKLVAISTFSVYDYMAMSEGDLLDESSPIDRSPARRDEYAQTKLLQEDLYREFGQRDGTRTVILRPGMIYGPDNLWHALLGAELGPRFMRVGSKAVLPLTYVENCAEAIVTAADLLPHRVELDNEIINIVDDDLPTQADYIELVEAHIDTPKSFGVPWSALKAGTGLLAYGNRRLFDGRMKFPGIAVPDRIHARFKPLIYTNAKAKRLLGWSPRYTTAESVARSAPTGREVATSNG